MRIKKMEKVRNIPITFDGKALFNIANVLGAVLAGYVSGFSIENIRKSLYSFIPSPELTPGRMNIFNFSNFTVMIDYAHNPHGMRALGKFIQSVKASLKVGTIAGVGDRRDEDLVTPGKEAAQIFDEVIVRMDDNSRGRTYENIFQLVSYVWHQTGRPVQKISLIPDEAEAVRTALTAVTPGSFIVILTDRITEAIAITKGYQQNGQPLIGPSTIDIHEISLLEKLAI